MGMLGANREARITQVEQQYMKPNRKEVLMKGVRRGYLDQVGPWSPHHFSRVAILFYLESPPRVFVRLACM